MGTLATAYFGFLSSARPVELAIYATQTAEVRLTQLANADTSEPLPVPTETVVSTTPTNNAVWNLVLRQSAYRHFRKRAVEYSQAFWTEDSIDVREYVLSPTQSLFITGKRRKTRNIRCQTTDWCATSSDILNQNLAFISIQFSANGESIPDENIGIFKYEPNKTWNCISMS